MPRAEPRPLVLRALVLGLLHGPLELLPVSSSAHAGLVLQDLAPDRRKELEVALHAGTLLALGPPRPRAWLVAATLPPAAAGALLEEPIERRLGTPATLAAGLLLGAAALAIADRAPRRRAGRRARPAAADALLLGAGQAAALVPGVSRHGAALSVLRARGLARPDAHAVSREAARPILLGATALKGLRVLRRRDGLGSLAIAAGASAMSTAVAARVLDGRGLDAPLWPYAAYRAGLAAVVIGSVRRADA